MGTPVVQPEQMLMAEEDGASLALDGPIAQVHANQALVTLRLAHLSNLNCYNSERYICYIGTPANITHPLTRPFRLHRASRALPGIGSAACLFEQPIGSPGLTLGLIPTALRRLLPLLKSGSWAYFCCGLASRCQWICVWSLC